MTKSTTSALFADDDDDSGASSPWDMPTPRKQTTRADLIRGLLPPSDVPDSYVNTFDNVVRDDGSGGRVTSGGVARTLAAAKLSADDQARVMAVLAPLGSDGELNLGRSEFNVLLALVGLAQEGETVSLDGVDERRRSESLPTLRRVNVPYMHLPITTCAYPAQSHCPFSHLIPQLLVVCESCPLSLHRVLEPPIKLEWVPISVTFQANRNA